jgi:hypothetical protein
MRVKGFEHGIDGLLPNVVHIWGIGVIAIDKFHYLVNFLLPKGHAVRQIEDVGALSVRGVEN